MSKKVIRDQDNFINAYDYITNQLSIYDYNNEDDLNIIKMKLKVLDGPISMEEAGGTKLISNTIYYKDQFITLVNDNQINTIYKLNIDETLCKYSKLEYISKLISFSPGLDLKTLGVKPSQFYNVREFVPNEIKKGNIIKFQYKYYETIIDHITESKFNEDNFIEINVIEYDVSNPVDLYTNDYIFYNNNIYKILEDIPNTIKLMDEFAFVESNWDEIGPALVTETNMDIPVNHFDSLSNELALIDIYIKEQTGLLKPAELTYDQAVLIRIGLLDKITTRINPLSGYNYADYETAYNNRPPLITKIECDEIYRTIFQPKFDNQEISSIKELITKVTETSTCHDIVSAEKSLSTQKPTENAEDDLRTESIELEKSIENKVDEYGSAYQEIHDLVYSSLNPTFEKLAKPWKPDENYSYMSTCLSDNNIGGMLEEGPVLNPNMIEVYNTATDATHMWFCKTEHMTSLDYPNFNTDDKKYEGYIKDNIATSYPYYCNEHKIGLTQVCPNCSTVCKVGIDPCPDCSDPLPDVDKLCPIGGELLEEGELKTLWVRPDFNRYGMGIEFPAGVNPPDPDPFDGFPLLSLFHRNPDTTELDLEAECGIFLEEFDYSGISITDIEGDSFPYKLASYNGWVFDVDGLITEMNPTPITEPDDDPLIWNQISVLDKIHELQNRLFGKENIGSNKKDSLGLCLVTQETIIPAQNTCCTGGKVSSIIEPDELGLPPRHKYDIHVCNECDYEMYDWVASRNICPLCGSSDIEFSREELGAIKQASNCGYRLPWNDIMKQHIFHNTEIENITTIELSPTNGRLLNLGKTLCAEGEISDCEPVRGCWEFQTEPSNYPLDLKYTKSFMQRKWIDWGYIDPFWICDYLEDPSVIWPGDHRGPEPGANGLTECPDLTYDPPMICNCEDFSGHPNNWANAPDALLGDWKDIYAIPNGTSPGFGFTPKLTGPDQHNLNTYGKYYNTPEEDWSEFMFCYYTDDGICEQTTSITVYKNRSNLPDGDSNPGDVTFQRFALLNSRVKSAKMNLRTLSLVVGDQQIVDIKKDVIVPNIEKETEETFEDVKTKKHQDIISLTEKCPEFI